MKIRHLYTAIISLCCAAGFTSCEKSELLEERTEIVEMYVAPTTSSYRPWGVQYPVECMLVKEEEDLDYRKMGFGEIIGFNYEKGYEYLLSVEKRYLSNPPADGSRVTYTLIEIIDRSIPDPQSPSAGASENERHFTYVVRSQDWIFVNTANGLNTLFMCSFSNANITDELYNRGYIVGQWVQSAGTSAEAIIPLPYTAHRGATDYTGNEIFWSETYSFGYQPGRVYFYVQYSNFDLQRPDDMEFRLVLSPIK